jgi:hypothetical protein
MQAAGFGLRATTPYMAGSVTDHSTNSIVEPSASRTLFAGNANLRLPGTVGMDDPPISCCDALGIKSGARNHLPRRSQCRHADAIRLQIGSEHGGGSERSFAEGNGRKSWDRMICETAARHDDGAGAGRPHGRGLRPPRHMRGRIPSVAATNRMNTGCDKGMTPFVAGDRHPAGWDCSQVREWECEQHSQDSQCGFPTERFEVKLSY